MIINFGAFPSFPTDINEALTTANPEWPTMKAAATDLCYGVETLAEQPEFSSIAVHAKTLEKFIQTMIDQWNSDVATNNTWRLPNAVANILSYTTAYLNEIGTEYKRLRAAAEERAVRTNFTLPTSPPPPKPVIVAAPIPVAVEPTTQAPLIPGPAPSSSGGFGKLGLLGGALLIWKIFF